jgi:hypothetical protein
MNERYPRVRIAAEHGELLIRDGLRICFYMRRSHHEVAQAVLRSLELYLHAVGQASLGWYVDMEGEMQRLDEAGWGHVRRVLLETRSPIIHLREGPGGVGAYAFEYYGKWLDNPHQGPASEAVSAVCFWLSTEFLEAHGPERVRELALKLAEPLPFDSGHAGLSFNAVTGLLSGPEEWRRLAFRHPGMDMLDLSEVSSHLGAKVRGPHWLSFLGQPVLKGLGGAEVLKARLTFPGTTVEPLGSERAVISLGLWPEAGDTETGRGLPAYRELARMLEPWLYQRSPAPRDWHAEYRQRWERRFLD